MKTRKIAKGVREKKGHSLVGISSIGLSRRTLGRIFHNHFWQSFYSLTGWNQAEKESMKKVCKYLLSCSSKLDQNSDIQKFIAHPTLLAIRTINIREFQENFRRRTFRLRRSPTTTMTLANSTNGTNKRACAYGFIRVHL